MWLLRACLVALLGVVGWYLARRFKAPAAAILGPMLLVGLATIFGLAHVDVPSPIKTFLQIIVGAFLGYNINRESVLRIRAMLAPIAIATAWIILSALLIGYLLAVMTQIDYMTAFLGTSPGGIAEMSAMAMSSHANVALVATLQTFRILSTVVAIPFLARNVGAPPKTETETRRYERADQLTSEEDSYRVSDVGGMAWVLWIALGVLGAVIFAWLNVPAAGVIGSMVFVGVVRASGVSIDRPPAGLRTMGQVGLGTLIGATFDEQTLMILSSEFALIALVTLATIVSSLGLAGIVQRSLKIDLKTALLACAPGGLVQMGIIADEMGAQVFIVNLFQLARMVCAILALPILFRMFV